MAAGTSLHSYGFEDIMLLLAFGGTVWVAGRLSSLVGLPPLVAEALVGSVLGPNCLQIVPESTALVLGGEVGLILLVIEAGLSIDLALLKKNGLIGLLMGFTGCFASLLIGFGLAMSCGLSVRSSLAVGASLAPTSFGVAVTVLKQATPSILQTPLGQLIIIAATFDDVLSLVILSEITVLSDASSTPLDFAAPVVSAVCFTTFLSAVAVYVVPPLALSTTALLLKSNGNSDGNGNGKDKDKDTSALLSLVLISSLGLCAAMHYGRCSHLFGAFLGGMCFCSFPDALPVWRHQVSGRIGKWLVKLFFACTIGFPLPIANLWTSQVFSLGFLFFCAVAGKLVLGFFSSLAQQHQQQQQQQQQQPKVESFAIAGLSMCCWGDFALYVAVTAKTRGLLQEPEYLGVMLAILASIIFASAGLGYWLKKRQDRLMAVDDDVDDEAAATASAPVTADHKQVDLVEM